MSLRKLIWFQHFFLALSLTVFSSSGTNAQTEPSLSARIIDALKAKEPNWKYIGAIESGRVPFVPSERRITVGIWEGPKSRSQDVVVSVYSVENREEAAKWLQPVRDKHVADGWQVSPFQIGDEGYLSKYKNGDRFDIEFRKGTVVAKIAGDDPDRVKEFAQCIVEQTAAN
jgi:hypothetical protein